MPQKYDLLIFDWDGTLCSSISHIAGAIQAACRDLGLPVPDAAAARHVIGLGLHEAMAYLLPGLDAAAVQEVADRYRYHYLLQQEEAPLFEGALETLQALHDAGHLLAVATGKSRRGLLRALNAAGLQDLFCAHRTADVCPSKPHPAMILELLEATGVAPERAVMIGDTSHDLMMARNAGIDALAAAYGAHDAAALLECHPVAAFDTFAGLQRWLLANA